MSLTIFSPPLELVRWSREAFLRVLRGVKHEGLAGWVETWAAFTMHGTACQVVQRGLLRVLRGVEREGLAGWVETWAAFTMHGTFTVCFALCSAAQLCLILCDHVDCSTPGVPVLHYLLEFAQTHIH